jgi:hypothetical protein
MRVQWRVSPKRGSNPRSPKAGLAFLAGERAASGIMSAQAARAMDASHRQRHRRASSLLPLTGISPWSRQASKYEQSRHATPPIRHPGLGFRGSMAGLCPPLPTLRRRPRGRQRTARGRCRSLLLHRSGLAPPTPCPAHFESSHPSHAVRSLGAFIPFMGLAWSSKCHGRYAGGVALTRSRRGVGVPFWRGLQSGASTPDDSRLNTPETTPTSIPTTRMGVRSLLILFYLVEPRTFCSACITGNFAFGCFRHSACTFSAISLSRWGSKTVVPSFP